MCYQYDFVTMALRSVTIKCFSKCNYILYNGDNFVIIGSLFVDCLGRFASSEERTLCPSFGRGEIKKFTSQRHGRVSANTVPCKCFEVMANSPWQKMLIWFCFCHFRTPDKRFNICPPCWFVFLVFFTLGETFFYLLDYVTRRTQKLRFVKKKKKLVLETNCRYFLLPWKNNVC